MKHKTTTPWTVQILFCGFPDFSIALVKFQLNKMSHTYVNPENINLFYCLSLIFLWLKKKYHIQTLAFQRML